MDLGEGMVAVVRGLPDAGLALTLMEGGRQYTLLPNAAIQNMHQPAIPFMQMSAPPRLQSASTETHPEARVPQGARHSSTQAVDGNYASVYKYIDNVVDMAAELLDFIKSYCWYFEMPAFLRNLYYALVRCNAFKMIIIYVEFIFSKPYWFFIKVAHCKIQPTSPPFALTEFPPQRAELCRGQGNFEVGGLGSGEVNHVSTKANGSYRGAMNWTDRGAVCTPRPSPERDPFAESLRRYPLGPRAELVDRLVAYTHARNNSPVKSRSPTSPGWSVVQGGERRCVDLRSQKVYDTEITDESPTKDVSRTIDFDSGDSKNLPFSRTYDVRYIRERNEKDNVQTVPTVTDSIHKETQAEIPMVSREVATVPRARPVTRNVAVSLSHSSSNLASSKEHHRKVQTKCSCKSIQTNKPTDLSMQTCTSSVDISRENKDVAKNCRKTKSQEEINSNDDIEQDLIHLIKELSSSSVSNTECIRKELLKKIIKVHSKKQSDKYEIKLGKCIKDQLARKDFEMFSRELSNELIPTIKANNIILDDFKPTNDVNENLKINNGSSEDKIKFLDKLIKDWLNNVPIKPVDYLGRHVKKDHVKQAIAVKIKFLVMSKVADHSFNSMKPELLDILEDIPLEVNATDKIYYLEKIVDDLVDKIEDIYAINAERKQWKRTGKKLFNKEAFEFKHVEPTENELKQFVNQEFKDFITKFRVKIHPNIEEQIQDEIIDLLINSIQDIRCNNDEQIKEDIFAILADFIGTSELESTYFVNRLTNTLRNELKESLLDNIQQSFIVLQNSVQNTSKQTQNHTNDFSIEGVSDQDILKNLDFYTKQIVKQVNEWMKNIQGIKEIDDDFKNVVAQDLADDIVDRHKYLELNPNSKGTDADELEHLKYQIFKWVNKLVGEDNLNTIGQASELMERIKNIPVPMLTRPIHNIDTNPSPNVDHKPGIITTLRDKLNDSSPNRKKKCPCSNTKKSEKHRSSKEITERDTSPVVVPNELASKPKDTQAITKHSGVMTSPEDNPKKVVFTETTAPEIPKSRPRGTSMDFTKPPRNKPRRCSGPPGFTSGYMNAEVSPNRVENPSCSPKEPTATSSIKQLNDEYDQYLQNWVQQIPIITSKPEEQASTEKMRLGVYNGVWKALTKLHMNPTTLDNPFYYQDVLDDEIEELLDLLPQSKELTNQKQTLKTQLIDKTIDMNKQIFNTTASSSYKQQLVDNITNNLPRRNLGMVGSDAMKICEEILKANLAEDYIMSKMYREVDQVKSNVYKKKLMKHMQEFFDFMKTTHGIEAKDIPLRNYRDEIINALARVPIPSDDTIKEEGEEILIGIEIEQWFSDLPLYPAENRVETLCRKRYIDLLSKKIHDMERQSNLNDCEDELRHEIKRFMGKLPLKTEDKENAPFMVEELVNRLKNRSRDIVDRSGVLFVDPNNYEEFSRDMPLCSSFSDAPDAKQTSINQSSFIIVGGERVNAPNGQNLKNRRSFQDPESQTEYLTMLPDSTQFRNQTMQEQGLQDGYPPEFRRVSLQASGQTSVRQAPSQRMDPQYSSHPQTCGPSLNRDDSGQPRDFSYPMAESMQRRPSLIPEQTTRLEANIGSFPEQTVHSGRRSFTDHRFDFPGQEFQGGSKSLNHSAATAAANGFGPQDFTRTHDPSTRSKYSFHHDQNRRHFNDRPYAQTPSDFFSQPMGFSTPQQNASMPRESRPKKRKTEKVNRSEREAARRRLSLSDSEESVKEEVRCRCMERVWRRKKSSVCCPCEESAMEFPPCFAMRYPPYPFYF